MLNKLVRKKVIGHGYFAEVTRYEDEEGERYALKCIKKEFKDNETYVKRFVREIEILEVIGKETNVIELIDCNKDELWYLMPEADENLAEYIKRKNSFLSEEDRINIFKEILKGITIAHSKGILHRDIAPNNILKIGNRWCVCDFGLGKDYSKHTVGGYSSVQGYGNFDYTAPEQFDKLKDASVQSDIFSLGKVFHFILSGKRPNDLEDLRNFKPLVKRATAQRVEGRYENISVLKRECEKYEMIYNSLESQNIGTFTVREYLASDSFDWDEFYEVAMKSNIINHVYYDYIDPIVDYLSTSSIIHDFKNIVGTDKMLGFLHKFIENLHSCYAEVGWPFSALNSFGYFLKRLFDAVPESPQCQLESLNELWELAAYHDQWAVQDIVVEMINNNKVPEVIEHEFAVHAMESERTFLKMNNINLLGVKSQVIRQAILSLRD